MRRHGQFIGKMDAERVNAYEAAKAIGKRAYGLSGFGESAVQHAAKKLGLTVAAIVRALRAVRHVDVMASQERRAQSASRLSATWAGARAARRASLRALQEQRVRGLDLPVADHWFVVSTVPMGEMRASLSLRERGYATYLPTKAVLAKVRRKGKEEVRSRLRALFPGYLFLAGRPSMDFAHIEASDGVAGILRNDGRAVPVPNSVIAHLARAEITGTFDERDQVIMPGNVVTVLDGPFKDFVITVTRIGAGKFIEGLVNLFGGTQSIRIDGLQNVRVA